MDVHSHSILHGRRQRYLSPLSQLPETDRSLESPLVVSDIQVSIYIHLGFN